METESGRPEQAPVRASDAERERVANLLREGASEGRITLEELSERLELAYAAPTDPELEATVEDLPARDGVPRPPARCPRPQRQPRCGRLPPSAARRWPTRSRRHSGSARSPR